MHGQRFFQAFSQAPGRAGIQIHQFAMQLCQRQLGGSVIFQRVRRVQLLGDQGLLFISQVIQHIASLMDFTALDRCRFAGVLFHRRAERLAAIQHIQSRLAEVQPAVAQP